MKKLLLIGCVLGSLFSFAQSGSPEAQNIKAVLETQQIAWNKGDIKGFMEGYWKSDSLTFIGKKGITKGWEPTLANYQKSYPDQSSMGELMFDIISVEMISNNTAYVVGKWNLKREASKGDLGGHFTLLFKKINNRWVIVSDHSS